MRDWTLRMVTLIETYGPVALAVWWIIFLATLMGFSIMISCGWRAGAGLSEEEQLSLMGTLGLAYLATALTRPIRVLATLALTPVVGRRFTWLFARILPASSRSETHPPSSPPNA
ncbi:MAG: FAM210 family protein [Myxococcales bacterium]|nr:FAM210 family protein [Myxococcales bacterium]